MQNAEFWREAGLAMPSLAILHSAFFLLPSPGDDVARIRRARQNPLHYRPLEDSLAERKRK